MPAELKPYTSRYVKVDANSAARFKCTRCGKCCTTGPNVVLTVFDVVRISRFLGVKPSELMPHLVDVIVADVVPFMYLRGSSGSCMFFRRKVDGEGLCVIYPARPMRCRLYPLLIESISMHSMYLDPKCPGLGEGPQRKLPLELVKVYLEEREKHYSLIFDFVVKRGLEPLVALKKALELAEDMESSIADLDYLKQLDFS